MYYTTFSKIIMIETEHDVQFHFICGKVVFNPVLRVGMYLGSRALMMETQCG